MATDGTFDTAAYTAHVEHYKRIQPVYEALAHYLEAEFKAAVKSLGLAAIVQARAKDVASFAEKIQRPGKDQYFQDPFSTLPDLCGARVITQTVNGSEAVVQYIENSDRFIKEESDDKLQSMSPSAFGYRSHHFTVRIPISALPKGLFEKDLQLDFLRAEIQVRTFLQHAWADFAHEAAYKRGYTLPPVWERELARIAAVLEAADHSFNEMEEQLEQFKTSYELHFSNEELKAQIKRGLHALEAIGENPDLAHKIAKMAMYRGDFETVIKLLSPWEKGNYAALLRDLGVCLHKKPDTENRAERLARAERCLTRAAKLNPNDIDTLASLAGLYRTQKKLDLARDRYREAYQKQPADPYALGNFIEFELLMHPALNVAMYMGPTIELASRRCVTQIKANINLPWAFFDLGKFSLLRGQPIQGLIQYAAGIADIDLAPTMIADFVGTALRTFQTLEPVRDSIPGYEWTRQFLELALILRGDKEFGGVQSAGTSSNKETHPNRPTVIITGAGFDTETGNLRTSLAQVFNRTAVNILFGCENPGIVEYIGDLQKANPKNIHLISYHHGSHTGTVTNDNYIDVQNSATDETLTPQEILAYWTHLSQKGVDFSTVRLLAIGGGEVAAAECAIALAFGVAVGVIERAGGEPIRLLRDAIWHGCVEKKRLLGLSDQSEEISSFIGTDSGHG